MANTKATKPHKEKPATFRPNELRPTKNGKSAKLTEIEKRPGYYKWWAKRADFETILFKLETAYKNVEKAVEREGGWFCIYVGIAVKESVRSRIDWHVNDEHDGKRIEKGYLSTLRQSISSIFAGNQNAQRKTNKVLDRLKVEVFYSDNGIGSDEAKRELEGEEKNLMKDHLYVLNIRDNVHPLAQDIRRKLRRLRKEAKAKALKSGIQGGGVRRQA